MRKYLHWKTYSVLIGLLIVIIGLFQFQNLAKKMANKERKNALILVEALETIANSEINEGKQDLNLASYIITQNKEIPLIICEEEDKIIDYINIDEEKIKNKKDYLEKQLEFYKKTNPPIHISYPYGTYLVYYGNSYLLNRIEQYPIFLIVVLSVFLIIVLISFSIAQKSIQNQVWVGMSKETAHQMGTPLSSIVGWIEILKGYPEINPYIIEMSKDVNRLQLVADRFSKIGSDTPLEETLIYPRLENMKDYMEKRAPKKVKFYLEASELSKESKVLMNAPLFEWVIENILNNALDALAGSGWIKMRLEDNGIEVIIDIENNGKIIPKKNFKKIFQPGETTKTRGWGLGLSLVKRIIEKYHYARIFVKKSDEESTVFRIVFRR